jgi:hypothetical protein
MKSFPLNVRIVQMWQRHGLIVDAIDERVDHQVALREAQLLDEAWTRRPA